jgi:hypothetical protein
VASQELSILSLQLEAMAVLVTRQGEEGCPRLPILGSIRCPQIKLMGIHLHTDGHVEYIGGLIQV